MSEVYSDEQLLSNIRQRAFEGLIFTVSLDKNCPIRTGLHQHLTAVLAAIDDLTSMVTAQTIQRLENEWKAQP